MTISNNKTSENPMFRKQLKIGTLYTATAKYSGIIISLLVTSVLSRLLSPSDFGVIAIATVFIVFFTIFSDMGLSSAIIQKRNLSKEDIKSLFSYTVYLGIILSVAFFLSSWIIAKIYNDTQLIIICQILSLNILFATLNIVPNGLLFRDKQFKYIGIRTIVVQVILASFSIVCALSGFGIYSLLINPVGSSILLFIISYIKYPIGFIMKPQFISIKKIAAYSIYTFGFNFINYFTRNLDKLFIGKVFGLAPLGYYEKSYRLMLLPVQNLTHIITPVLHPVLADYQYDREIQTMKYLKLRKILSIVGFPLSVLLFFSATELVLLIFGSQWIPSIPVFKILSLTIGFQITESTIGAYYLATDNTKPMFYIGLINTIINIMFLLIGIYGIGNIEGVAWMWVVSTIVGFWNLFYFAKLARINAIKAIGTYFPAIVPTVITIFILYVFSTFLTIDNLIIRALIYFVSTGLIILISLKHYGFIDGWLKND